jgi:hypothetical protein
LIPSPLRFSVRWSPGTTQLMEILGCTRQVVSSRHLVSGTWLTQETPRTANRNNRILTIFPHNAGTWSAARGSLKKLHELATVTQKNLTIFPPKSRHLVSGTWLTQATPRADNCSPRILTTFPHNAGTWSAARGSLKKLHEPTTETTEY